MTRPFDIGGFEGVCATLGDWLDRTLAIPGNHDDRDMVWVIFGRPEVTGDGVCFRFTAGHW